MTKLSHLFELQKFAGNKELENIINDTHTKYIDNNIIELSDDELELAAAGTGNMGLNEQTCKAMCLTCNKMTIFKCYSGGRAVCSECGEKTIL
ncbi:MAG: hypothetical protein Q4D29_10780 [Lachnospiraceae bacterium]|nr:hypothetical protein [Lachnospiraceae bacterium]